jgi:hypothetical protein
MIYVRLVSKRTDYKTVFFMYRNRVESKVSPGENVKYSMTFVTCSRALYRVPTVKGPNFVAFPGSEEQKFGLIKLQILVTTRLCQI